MSQKITLNKQTLENLLKILAYSTAEYNQDGKIIYSWVVHSSEFPEKIEINLEDVIN